VAHPARGCDRGKRVSRLLQAGGTRANPVFPIAAGAVQPARQPVRIRDDPNIRARLADRPSAAGSLQSGIEITHQFMVEADCPVRLTQPERFFAALEERDCLATVLNSLAELTR